VLSLSAALGTRDFGLAFGLASPSTAGVVATRFLGFFFVDVDVSAASYEPLRNCARDSFAASSSSCGAKCSERTKLPTVANPRIASGGMDVLREPNVDAPEGFFFGLARGESVGSGDAGMATRRGEGRGLPWIGDEGA
jgi:hypothetical protein